MFFFFFLGSPASEAETQESTHRGRQPTKVGMGPHMWEEVRTATPYHTSKEPFSVVEYWGHSDSRTCCFGEGTKLIMEALYLQCHVLVALYWSSVTISLCLLEDAEMRMWWSNLLIQEYLKMIQGSCTMDQSRPKFCRCGKSPPTMKLAPGSRRGKNPAIESRASKKLRDTQKDVGKGWKKVQSRSRKYSRPAR